MSRCEAESVIVRGAGESWGASSVPSGGLWVPKLGRDWYNPRSRASRFEALAMGDDR